MGVEVPEGNPPEQAMPAEENSQEKQHQINLMKKLVMTVLFLLIVCAVLLIALVPDWGNENVANSVDEGEPPTEDDNVVESKTTAYFESNLGPFDVKMPLFSSEVTEGYATEEELENDLEQLAKFLLNEVLNSQSKQHFIHPVLENTASGGDAMVAAPGAPEGGVTADETADETEGAGGSDLGDATDFETNNQEENVDKSDRAKSNGDLFFVAYDDTLVIFDKQGDFRRNITMPPINIEYDDTHWDYPSDVKPSPTIEPEIDEPVDMEEARSSMYYWNPKPYINTILLEDNRLTVIVSGYSAAFTSELEETPVLGDYLGTHIRVYEITDDDDILSLVSTTDVNGAFRNAYSIQNNAYVVTQSWINTWDHLLAPIQRWQPMFVDLSDEEYLTQAAAYAEAELIPAFVEKLVSELFVSGEIDLARLSVYADSVSGNSEIETSLFSGAMANAVTQVVSFDMNSDTPELESQITGTFQPGSWGHVYATDGMIIVADQGWSWVEEADGSAQKTFLLCFELDGPSSSHSIVGSVDGYLLNPYSLDFVTVGGNKYVRIATTMDFWFWGGMIEPIFVDTAVMEEETVDEEMIGIDEEEENVIDEPPPDESEWSSTKNQLFVLKFPASSLDDGTEPTLEVAGNVTLGKPNERFTAIRFFDTIAYAVTFQQRDPFYVIGFSDPETPEILGELDISGFSEYLHPINTDNTVLLAVGQETDDEGQTIGLQISIFDAQDPTNPTLVNRTVLEHAQNQWASTSVSWDERAFRYLKLDENSGRLIIPMSIHSWTVMIWDEEIGEHVEVGENESFEGFSVFSIENNSIEFLFDIDHSLKKSSDENNNIFHCGYCGWLPERSFVIEGDVITLKQYSVVSTDLVSSETEWTLDLSNAGSCCSGLY